ncbi:Bug family tripartite tricarboxylate transporter substrate binding protein [Variovorax soli]|uniref:Bug family tripartite tricarboxylate transporter substrate binding protein n=1 Tax=Variovorax soli TaxID=376815 RepID=UPI000837D625|nr:tripartite tricarboxylate transporter substrate binding protein [Variovorax soli]
MNTFTRRGALRTIAAGAASLALPAFAAWPERPIKIIVSFPAGGASDIVARVLGEQLARKLGQPVVIDNRPGAGGSVGGLAVTQAAPDGYTLLLSNSTPISIGPFALEKQPYDPVEGFTHIALIGTAPCVVMANPQTTLKTMADIEKQAKASGRLDFGSGGPASIGHIYGELMRKEMNAQLVHVPYRGGAPMTTDLIAGIIPMGIDVLTAFVPYFKAGQIRPVAVTSKQRSSLVPDVPTVVEAGYPGLVLENFFGLSGPAKMPADVVSRLNGATGEVLQDADFKKKMAELGIATQPTSAAGFAAFVREQVAQLAPVVKGSGVKL